ncbi:hypothetical protein [Rhodococcus sp. I2R]|uniref:hypothetical protein n=1 Tax=Rhodococcus sp. I2R TaxID=2855445 RepID=UPI001E2C8DBB|nr:hypothetical protein [Rhodococcus sp. I2R]MCC8930812.1 hypothetical protein [Rhodococcus sp. I2R]
MKSRVPYVTPTDRPQWPTGRVRRWLGIVLVSWVLPFALSSASVYGLIGLYLLAGGRG